MCNDNGGGNVTPENSRIISSRWEHLKDCGRCGHCPLKDVRVLNSRRVRKGWTFEAEERTGQRLRVVSCRAKSGHSQEAATEYQKWEGRA